MSLANFSFERNRGHSGVFDPVYFVFDARRKCDKRKKKVQSGRFQQFISHFCGMR